MMNSIIGQLSFEDKKDLARYHPCYFQRQVVAHFVLFKDLVKVWIRDNIRSVYGGLDKEGGVGPFSVKGYLKYILKDKKWGDSIFLGLVASMWACRITILGQILGGKLSIDIICLWGPLILDCYLMGTQSVATIVASGEWMDNS